MLGLVLGALGLDPLIRVSDKVRVRRSEVAEIYELEAQDSDGRYECALALRTVIRTKQGGCHILYGKTLPEVERMLGLRG